MGPTRDLELLHPGRRVKVKGASAHGGGFAAVEVELRPPKDKASIEGMIERVDPERREITLLGRSVTIPEGVVIEGLNGEQVPLAGMRPRSMIKLAGRYLHGGEWKPESIRLKETLAFNIEKIQGPIERVDADAGTLEVLGFTVALTPRTVIEGL